MFTASRRYLGAGLVNPSARSAKTVTATVRLPKSDRSINEMTTSAAAVVSSAANPTNNQNKKNVLSTITNAVTTSSSSSSSPSKKSGYYWRGSKTPQLVYDASQAVNAMLAKASGSGGKSSISKEVESEILRRRMLAPVQKEIEANLGKLCGGDDRLLRVVRSREDLLFAVTSAVYERSVSAIDTKNATSSTSPSSSPASAAAAAVDSNISKEKGVTIAATPTTATTKIPKAVLDVSKQIISSLVTSVPLLDRKLFVLQTITPAQKQKVKALNLQIQQEKELVERWGILSRQLKRAKGARTVLLAAAIRAEKLQKLKQEKISSSSSVQQSTASSRTAATPTTASSSSAAKKESRTATGGENAHQTEKITKSDATAATTVHKRGRNRLAKLPCKKSTKDKKNLHDATGTTVSTKQKDASSIITRTR